MSFFKKFNRLDWITLIIFTLIIIELFYSVVFQGRYETCEYPIYYFLFSVYFMVMVFRLVTRMGTVIPNYEDRSTKILLTYILPINFIEAIIGLYLQIGNQITTSDCEETADKISIWFWIVYTAILGIIGVIFLLYIWK